MARQASLFEERQALPSGLVYMADFLTESDEREILEGIGTIELKEARYKAYTARRRVASFGAGYDFDANELTPAPEMAPFLLPLRGRIARWLGMPAECLGYALVAEYRPGTQLGWHRDVPQFETVVGVSLAGMCRMRLRRYPPRPREPALALDLAPRSAYVLQGEARWDWQHAIAPTPELRYSVTFRTRRESRGP